MVGRNVGGQRGDTLVEVLIAIAIIAIVGLAAFAGLQTAIRSSVDSRELGRAEAIVRSAAENLQNPETAYVDKAGCPSAGTYSGLATLPSGYTLTVANVQFWNSTATSPVSSSTTLPTTFAGCPVGADQGLQMVTLRVNTPAGATAELDVLKRRPNAP